MFKKCPLEPSTHPLHKLAASAAHPITTDGDPSLPSSLPSHTPHQKEVFVPLLSNYIQNLTFLITSTAALHLCLNHLNY